MSAIPVHDVPVRRKASGTWRALGGCTMALATATLLLVLYVGLSALVPGQWTFASTSVSRLRGELGGCLAVVDRAARLTCFDEIARRPPPHPAKGANAPAAAFAAGPPAP